MYWLTAKGWVSICITFAMCIGCGSSQQSRELIREKYRQKAIDFEELTFYITHEIGNLEMVFVLVDSSRQYAELGWEDPPYSLMLRLEQAEERAHEKIATYSFYRSCEALNEKDFKNVFDLMKKFIMHGIASDKE